MEGASPDLLRQRYKIQKGEFAVILIGKGGTEKLRRFHPVSNSALFETIDAMPMRQREMGK